MLFITELNPKLNTHKLDSIRSKLITRLCRRICCHYHYIDSLFISQLIINVATEQTRNICPKNEISVR